MANPILTGLTAYVDETREELLSKSVLGAKSAQLFNLMSGVNSPTALHLLDTNITFQDGTECSWNPEGTAEISQRVVTPAILKVNMSFCPKQYLNTYASHMVKVNAGFKTLPYEQEFVNDIVKKINYGVEKMLWNGDSDNGNECDGLIKILESDGAISVTGASGTSAYEAIKKVYQAIPENVLQNENVAIFVSAGIFRAYVQEVIALNLYHYNDSENPMETMLIGTNAKIIATNGLNDVEGYDYIVAASLDNLYYACDMEGDKETFDIWFSDDAREVRLAVEFAVGTNVAFPDQVVLGKFAK